MGRRGIRRNRGRAAAWPAAALLVVVVVVAAVRLGPSQAAPGRSALAGHQARAAAHTSTPAATPAHTPGARHTAPARLLAGRVVGIDPGHNGGNAASPGYINRLIWNGREEETCDTTGTQTDGGYTEATYNFSVAQYLRADLRREGARVVLTRTGNTGAGPCVDRRAAILNDAHTNVAIDIHADGGPSWGRGFTVLEPVADGPNDKVIASSVSFGHDAWLAMAEDTGMPVSDYYGHSGIQARDDLAGLNLTTVPKVLIECGNMRNGTDAALLTSAEFQRKVAAALAAAITRFLGA